MRRSGRALLFASVVSAIVFVVGAFQPYCRVAFVSVRQFDMEAVSARETSLWGWLSLDEDKWANSNAYRYQNRRNLVFLSTVAVLSGLGVYWLCAMRRRPSEASDYTDGPAGVTTDGRMVKGD